MKPRDCVRKSHHTTKKKKKKTTSKFFKKQTNKTKNNQKISKVLPFIFYLLYITSPYPVFVIGLPSIR